MCAVRSPDESIREQVRDIIGKERFTLIYMDESLEDCKKCDEDLYRKAEEGLIDDVPGVDTKYDVPQDADYKIKKSNFEAIEELIRRI